MDTRLSVLEIARQAAAASGVADRCVFSTQVDEKADLIFSIDWFEHYDDVASNDSWPAVTSGWSVSRPRR